MYTFLSQSPQLARVPSGRHFDKPLNCLLGHSIIFSQIERWGTGSATSYGFSTQVCPVAVRGYRIVTPCPIGGSKYPEVSYRSSVNVKVP